MNVESYVIQNSNGNFGFLVNIKKEEEYAVHFKMYKIKSVYEDEQDREKFDVELVSSGDLRWDGSLHSNFGRSGYVYFGGADDMICFTKSLEFIWKYAEKGFLENQVFDEWIVKEEEVEKREHVLYQIVE